MSRLEPSFSVPYSFPVYFTRNLWQTGHNLFSDVVRRCEPSRHHRVLVVVDDGLAAARPSLITDIQAHAAAHADAFSLVAPPLGPDVGDRSGSGASGSDSQDSASDCDREHRRVAGRNADAR